MVIIRILFSRKKKKTQNKEEEKQIQERIKECLKCPYNSLNMEKIPLNKRILKFLSDLYSRIMGKSNVDNKGNCTACNSCSVYYKAQELEFEDCPKGKWKKYESSTK